MKTNSILIALFLVSVIPFTLTGTNYAQIVKTTTESEENKADADYDLTDVDRYESQIFVHEGLSQRQMLEACEKLDDPSACQGRGKTEFMGVDSNMVMAVSKVYSMFGAMVGMNGGGGFTSRGKKTGSDNADPSTGTGDAPAGANDPDASAGDSADTSSDAAKEGEGEEKKDYCAMIPAAGEAVAMMAQQLGQQTIESEAQAQETAQKAQLYKASRSHATRAKSAKIQGTVWGSTTACYGAYMAAGNIVIDWKVIAKTAGAGFLTAFWLNEAKQQEKYAAAVKEIADELPGKGECNPHTDNDCYCSQPETQYDPQHCVPELHAKALKNDSFSIPCVDKDMNPDAQCDCISQEACFDSEFFSDVKAPGFVQFAESSAGKDFKDLTRGSLNNGKLSAGSNSSAAKAKRLLGDLSGKLEKNTPLNSENRGAHDALESMGVPGPLARLLASQPISAVGKNKFAGLGARGSSGKYKSSGNSRSGSKSTGVLRFNNANGKTSAVSKSKGTNYKSMLNKFKNKKGKSKASTNTMRFAQKAEQSAQITKDKGRPIFEIISRRYQVSGWRRLEIE